MSWIELTVVQTKSKIIINANHLVLFGANKKGDTPVGSYVVLSVAVGQKPTQYIDVIELPAAIEALLSKATGTVVQRHAS